MGELKKKIEEAEECDKKQDLLGASILYKEALEVAKNIGDSATIKYLKSKLTSSSKNIDYQTIEVQQKIPQEEIDKFISTVITNDPLNIILKNVGVHPYLRPRIDDIEKQAKQSMPVSFHIVDLTTFSKDGHVIENGDDPVASWTAKMYEISQSMIGGLYLSRIFSELKSKKGLTADTLYKYLEEKHTFPKDSLPIIKIGLERYFSNDFVSSIHILIPQFENVLLQISEKLGFDIIALNRSAKASTSTRVMSEILLSDEKFQKSWGRDFCEQVKYVLLSPLGFKLRHKVAHGEITLEECNQMTNELIIHLMLILAGRIERKSPPPDPTL